MSNLTQYQETEIAEIVEDALAVTPVRYQAELTRVFGYLAMCYVQERNGCHLADIQALIDTAKNDNRSALAQMQNQLNTEIAQLRAETRQGFEKVAECLGMILTRQTALEERLERLEQRSTESQVIYVASEPTVVNYYIDNSDNRRYSRSDGGNIEAFAWAVVICFFSVLICTLIPMYGRR